LLQKGDHFIPATGVNGHLFGMGNGTSFTTGAGTGTGCAAGTAGVTGATGCVIVITGAPTGLFVPVIAALGTSSGDVICGAVFKQDIEPAAP